MFGKIIIVSGKYFFPVESTSINYIFYSPTLFAETEEERFSVSAVESLPGPHKFLLTLTIQSVTPEDAERKYLLSVSAHGESR